MTLHFMSLSVIASSYAQLWFQVQAVTLALPRAAAASSSFSIDYKDLGLYISLYSVIYLVYISSVFFHYPVSFS